MIRMEHPEVNTATTDKDIAERAAVEAATNWLALLDEGNLEASWEAAAQRLKTTVSKPQWTKSLRARSAIGALQSRKLLSATYAKATLPGEQEGHFVVIHFEASFEYKPAAVEMVTPMLEENGRWKVSGYSVR
jgi:hypothetical protein